MDASNNGKIVNSEAITLKVLFQDKFDVDFYQREYVWETKQLSDLINDLSTEFIKNWREGDELQKVRSYDPYFMGEVVLSIIPGKRCAIIDGQQRITTLTLLLIYLLKNYGHLPQFPKKLEELISSDDFGTPRFNLDIEERRDCMRSLLENGSYVPKPDDNISVRNLVARYNDIADCWDTRIDESNVVAFAYWVQERIVFSKVWTNSNDFAYVIFETMNDRGLSLTQVEMLRSYILANIDSEHLESAMKRFDDVVARLVKIKLSSKSKAEIEFFRVYLRSHYAQDLSQSKNSNSDFTRIGKEFHRWVREKEQDLGLTSPKGFLDFLDRIEYFAGVYEKINMLIQERDAENHLYLIVNSDYNFTLQTPAILAAIAYQDSEEVVLEKIHVMSRYITRVITWRTWNHWMISQSSMEALIYAMCKEIRDMSLENLKEFLKTDPLYPPKLNNPPVLNQQIKNRLRVMLSLITAIVGKNSNEPVYMLNSKESVEVEHIWANHFDQHSEDCPTEAEFDNVRNSLGDLLVLPKSFNSSYGDLPYEEKMPNYFSQNILAQSLCPQKYERAPGFRKYMEESGLPFVAYEHFTKASISERAELYKAILIRDLEGEE